MNALQRLSPKQRLALAGVLAVGVFLFMRNRTAQTGIDGTLTPPDTTTTDTGTLDTGGTTSPTGGDATGILDALQQQGELIAAIQSRQEDLSGSLSDIASGISGLASTAAPYTDPYATDPYATAGDTSGLTMPPDTIADPLLGPAGQTPPAAPGNASATAASAQAGFYWSVGGKRTYVTKQNRQSFLDELRRHGVNPEEWASQHPAAAALIGIGSAGPFVPSSRVPPRVAPPRATPSLVPSFGHVRPNDRGGPLGIGAILARATHSASRTVQAVHASQPVRRASTPRRSIISQAAIRSALSQPSRPVAKAKPKPPPAPVHLHYL